MSGQNNKSSRFYYPPDPESYVAVVTIPKADAEAVTQTLGRLYHNEGWNSTFVGLSSAGSACAVGAVCDRALKGCIAFPSLDVPQLVAQKNLSLVVPNRSAISAYHSRGPVRLHSVPLLHLRPHELAVEFLGDPVIFRPPPP